MKTLYQHINERLVLSKNRTKTTVAPETVEELQDIIINEIITHGPECSLNFIDVSKIVHLDSVFFHYVKDFSSNKTNILQTNLMRMEINGILRKLPGNYYELVR